MLGHDFYMTGAVMYLVSVYFAMQVINRYLQEFILNMKRNNL